MPSLEFRFDTGRLSLDLLATLGQRSGRCVERLCSPQRLVQWLMVQQLPVREPLGDDELRRIIALREALQRVFAATLGGQPATGADVRLVNESARTPAPVRMLALHDGPPPTVTSVLKEPPTFDAALSAIAGDAIDLIGGPQLADVARCASDTCDLFFLDPSHRRRYCDPARCGTRARVAAHRARRRGVETTT